MDASLKTLIEFLESMTGTRWMIAGFGLLVIEVLTGTSYILWPAFAALLVGLFTFLLPIGWEMQFLLFVLATAALLYFGHTVLKPRMKGGEPSDLNDRARSMKGMKVKAVADFETGRGRVHVGDTQWRASMETGNAKAGDVLKVITIKGTTLTVEPL